MGGRNEGLEIAAHKFHTGHAKTAGKDKEENDSNKVREKRDEKKGKAGEKSGEMGVAPRAAKKLFQSGEIAGNKDFNGDKKRMKETKSA